jgi:hypothetical protein
MTLLAVALALIIWALAAIHAYWGLGGVWPATDARSLARAVVGAPQVQTMPPASACFAVALVLLGVGSWPLFAMDLLPAIWPTWLVLIGGVIFATVFLTRGAAAYHPAWRRLVPEQPFAAYDQGCYGPLCLMLGLGFAVLVAKGYV